MGVLVVLRAERLDDDDLAAVHRGLQLVSGDRGGHESSFHRREGGVQDALA
jgi:hypothetical protein